MDKIILSNGKEIEFKNLDYVGGQHIKLTLLKECTIDEIENVMTTENLSNVKFSNFKSEAYGKYSNLKLESISKIIATKEIIVNLTIAQ